MPAQGLCIPAVASSPPAESESDTQTLHFKKMVLLFVAFSAICCTQHTRTHVRMSQGKCDPHPAIQCYRASCLPSPAPSATSEVCLLRPFRSLPVLGCCLSADASPSCRVPPSCALHPTQVPPFALTLLAHGGGSEGWICPESALHASHSFLLSGF